MQGCSSKFPKKLQERTAPESLFNKAAASQQIARTFNSIWSSKKSSENVHISLKTKSKHQVTYLKIQIISKC